MGGNTLALASFKVTLSLPDEWGNKEGDAACALLRNGKLERLIRDTVASAIRLHKEFDGVEVSVESDAR